MKAANQDDPKRRQPNIARAMKQLGWRPVVSHTPQLHDCPITSPSTYVCRFLSQREFKELLNTSNMKWETHENIIIKIFYVRYIYKYYTHVCICAFFYLYNI